MSTFTLKLLAIIFMLIDHIGAVFASYYKYPELYFALRAVGRLAFPIFVFLIVEGYFHTHDVKKYMKRLGIFALISEIPFDLAFYHENFNTDIITDIKSIFGKQIDMHQLGIVISRLFSNQNVFFTLFLGLLLIYSLGLVEKRYEKNLVVSNALDALITLGIIVAAFLLRVDYGYIGILMIAAFYLFRGNKLLLTIVLFLLNGFSCRFDYYSQTHDPIYIIQLLATFAMIPIAFYNGKKGKNIKYFFYIFYPAHLLLLFLIYKFTL